MRIQCEYSEEEEEEKRRRRRRKRRRRRRMIVGYSGVTEGYNEGTMYPYSSLPSVATILLPLLKRVSTCFIQKWTCPNVSVMML